MATLALAAAGAAVGGALLPGGISVLGVTLGGAAIGSQIGALAGSVIDQSLFASSGQARTVEGPRLNDLRVMTSTEGAAIPRLYGRARLGGQVIWATDFEEEVVTASAGGSGKGGATAKSSGSTSITYQYYANFAVALCEGEISGIGRVWADGQEIDLGAYTTRLHLGTETQLPDSLISARLGADAAPAYRGTAYIVFERLPLQAFGNRLPQLSFEVHRAVDDLERKIRGVVLIPGSGEFAYAPEAITRTLGLGHSVAENIHTRQGGTDWDVALDQLQATLPSSRSVSLVVSWFGSDLRAGECELRPRVDIADKLTSPLTWQVAGETRASAQVVSLHEGRPAYGGTPSDESVIAAIRDLKARGFSVVLNPFVLMDVPAGNTLPDPYTGGSGQPAYPWRGRITCDPAPGRFGSPDKSGTAATQIANFVGAAAPSDYTLTGDQVIYSGPTEWSYRRMILHYAKLAVAAGGVDAFLLGSELRGLTQVRSSTSTYPFVTALASLAADVKSIVGPSTKVTYAADWSEYFGHQPDDGTGDVHFHLDPLWSSSSIDAIGIDVYWPLADWREGRSHLDYVAGTRSIHDLEYLKANLFGGEGYDWYYASPEDRDAQTRTPITDGSGKPWMFRYKDIRSWWLNSHFDRPGGVESGSPTAWVPQSKPFWFLEIGCPAVDKGANQPNLFSDPKSSESSLPHYSRGNRDDLMQRRVLQAFHDTFDPDAAGYTGGSNPTSAVYDGRMVDLDHIHAYAWDARPFPAFPNDIDAWGDGANWRLGHWLNGRMSSATLAGTVARILEDNGFANYDVTRLTGMLTGYALDRIMSARDALQPLELAYFVDAIETDGVIAFRHRGSDPNVVNLAPDDLVETSPDAALFTLTRGQETELPAVAKITHIDADADYMRAVAQAQRRVGGSSRVAEAQLPIVIDSEQAARIADTWLFEAWASRERAAFTLPPSLLAIEPAESIALAVGNGEYPFRLTEIAESGSREVTALALDPNIYSAAPSIRRDVTGLSRPAAGAPFALFLDLTLLKGDESATDGYVAAVRKPWPGAVAFYCSPESSGFTLRALATAPATIGTTLDPVPRGPESRIDHAARFRVRLDSGSLASVTELAMLAGSNAAAIAGEDGRWEIIQFQNAELVAPQTYLLSHLLRAQAGTELAMGAPLAAGSRFVLLDASVARVSLTADEIGLPFVWRLGPASEALAASSYTTASHAFLGAGRRPLSPVHIRGSRTGGDLAVSWIRRTRSGGDSWDGIEVPLAEDNERYDIEILDGSNVVRTLTTNVASVSYPAADQIADFGAAQPNVDVRIYQISATAGRGSPSLASV
jgi:hypothetical protein